jgi:hypothetical protein
MEQKSKDADMHGWTQIPLPIQWLLAEKEHHV